MAGIWSRFFGTSVSTAAGYGMGSALGPALAPVTQSAANEAWSIYPTRPLPATIAAGLVAEGKLPRDDGAAEALHQGFTGVQFDRMVAQLRTVPQLGNLLEMLRRGIIDANEFDQALEVERMPQAWRDHLKALRFVPPPLTDTIRMAVREVFSPGLRQALDLDSDYPAELDDRAADIGLSPENARNYWAAHWDLPSYTQAADMLHRNIITQDEFDQLLRALDYAPTWRDKLRELARRIPPISDLIRFSVREVYQDATAAKYGYDDDYPARFTADASLHGMDASRAKQYWRAHWRLPSVSQGYVMRRRGLIGDAELDDLLRVQDYPSYWRAKLMATRFLVPGRIDLRRMFIAGLIDRAETKAGYQRLGYEPADAELLTQLAEAAKAGDTATATFVGKAQTQLWTRTHTAFLNGELAPTAAKQKLAQAGVPAGERDAVVNLWIGERELVRKELTPTQIKKAWKKPVTNRTTGNPWTRDDAVAALIALGYSANDADEFLDL